MKGDAGVLTMIQVQKQVNMHGRVGGPCSNNCDMHQKNEIVTAHGHEIMLYGQWYFFIKKWVESCIPEYLTLPTMK